MIIRIFHARIPKEQVSNYKRMLHTETIPWLREQPGLVNVFVGEPLTSEDSEFIVVTFWQDLDALKTFVGAASGANWREPVVTPDEESLVEKAWAEHFLSSDPTGTSIV